MSLRHAIDNENLECKACDHRECRFSTPYGRKVCTPAYF